MNTRCFLALAGVAGAITSTCLSNALVAWASTSSADNGWVAVAGSPSRESLDWAYGTNQAAAESKALAQCAQLQQADNCVVLSSSANCVAVAWDADQPLNRPHAASSATPQAAMQGAVAAAGSYANDPHVRCTWFTHT